MKVLYYIVAVAVLVLAGFGIYASRAQNAAQNAATDGIIVIEEDYGVAEKPLSDGVGQADASAQKLSEIKDSSVQKYKQQKKEIKQDYQKRLNHRRQSGQEENISNPQDEGSEMIVEEDEIETMD